MERQKQVKVSASLKAETFLNQVYLKIGKGDIFSLDTLAREHKLSGSFATAIKRQKIVEKIGNRKESTWQWIYPTKPDKALALTIMDEINRHSGTFNANSLKRALNQSDTVTNLFNSSPQMSERVMLAGFSFSTLLSAELYRDPTLEITDKVISKINERAIFATEDLLNKLYNNQNLKP